jgi:hypothetical protein
VAILAVIVVVASPLLPLNRIFGDDEDRFEDHLDSLKDRLEYSFGSGKLAEAHRSEDDSDDGTGIARQPAQQAESRDISRISDVVGTVPNPNQCVGDSGGANTASARNATGTIQYASSTGGFGPEKAAGLEVVNASEVKCGHRINQDAAAG